MGMLQCLLAFNLGHDIGQTLDKLQEFNVLVSKYNAAVPIGDELADTILVAIIIRAVRAAMIICPVLFSISCLS